MYIHTSYIVIVAQFCCMPALLSVQVIKMLFHKIPIAIVTVMSITSTSQVFGSVRYMKSPLPATGRNHTCLDEPQSFICQVDGEYLRWTFDSTYRATLFHDHDVSTVRIVSGQHGIQAILIGNDALRGNVPASTRRLRSALIIESSSVLRGDIHNISCSSDTDVQVHQIHVAEIPRKLLNVHVSPVKQSVNSSEQTHYTLSVRWDLPDNIERFDLERFKVHVSILQPDTGIQYNSSNGTDTNLGHLFVVPHDCIAQITVTAINKCSQEGLESDPVTWPEDGPLIKNINTKGEQSFTTLHKINNTKEVNPAFPFINGFKDLLPSLLAVMMGSVLSLGHV